MAEESPVPLPPAEESIEAETDAAVEPEPDPGELATEPSSEPGFVCDCKEWTRSACEGLPFYKEHESRLYCVLHYPGKEKSSDFKAALDSKLNKKDFDFRGVWFPDEVDFDGFEFSAAVDFSSATFGADTCFSSATFSAYAEFRSTTKWKGWRFWKTDWLHMLYWAVSGYGERIRNALGVLAAVWIVFVLLYTRVGFAQPPPKASNEGASSATAASMTIEDRIGQPLEVSRALTYSLSVMSLQRPEPRPLTNWAHTLVTLETILGPVQAALLALAIRRKFMR